MTQQFVKAQMVYDVKYHFYSPPYGETIEPQIFYNVDGSYEYTSTIACATESVQDVFIPPSKCFCLCTCSEVQRQIKL